jgi:hypothetical protein
MHQEVHSILYVPIWTIGSEQISFHKANKQKPIPTIVLLT